MTSNLIHSTDNVLLTFLAATFCASPPNAAASLIGVRSMVGISSAAIQSVCREIGLCSSGRTKDLSVGENKGAAEGFEAGVVIRGDGGLETSGAPILCANNRQVWGIGGEELSR